GQGRYRFNQQSGPAATAENASGVSATGTYNVVLALPSGFRQASTSPAPMQISRGDVNLSGVNFVVAATRQGGPPSGHHSQSSAAISGSDLTLDAAALDPFFAQMSSRHQ